jgi:hypothetical protein
MRKILLCLRPLRSLLFVGCLTGCAASPGSQALVDAFHQIRADGSSHENSSHLDPRFKYLRVQVGRREVFMALGYVDSHPEGPVEVWYSGTGEVLRLRDGRLIGATMNMGTDWLSVSFTNLPRWEQVGEEASFERNRDISPGYQYGIREKMLIQHIPQPKNTQLQLIQPSSLVWYEERADGVGSLPPARYGVSLAGAVPQVVYAEQCLSSDLCFSWQRWMPLDESKH